MNRTIAGLTKWVKKIHMYLGLLNLTILMIFGIVGLTSSFLPPASQRDQAKSEVRYVPYQAPSDLSDRALADHAYEVLKIVLTQPAPNWSVHRDQDNNLRFRLPTPAKVYDVMVLEKEAQLRVTSTTKDVWSYLFNLHEMTMNNTTPDWRIQMWGLYIELSIWSLIFMTMFGVILWLTSRPQLRWAQISFALGIVFFVVLWTLSR